MTTNYENKPKTLKINNRKLILNNIIDLKEVTIADLQDKINLSKTTLAKIINYLVEHNLIVESGKSNSTNEGGRKASIYKFNASFGYCIAIHMFPDELYANLTDLNINMISSYSVPLSSDISFNQLIEMIVVSVNHLLQTTNITIDKLAGIAIGTHGITNYATGKIIHSSHFKNLTDSPSLKEALNNEISKCPPIYTDNQIHFQALAEKHFGMALNKKNVIVIEAGIGLVAGIIVKDQIKRGDHHLSGEIGHMIIAPDSEEICSCGAKGCFEVMVSEKRLRTIIKRKSSQYPSSKLNLNSFSLESMFKFASEGDNLSLSLIEEMAKWFAIGLINIILMYDPEIIVIQGGYSKCKSDFIEMIKKNIRIYSPILDNVNVNITTSSLGKNRGTLGGAIYVTQHYLDGLDLT